MGQKVHPKVFRLIAAQKHLSHWYSNKFNYSHLLEEDFSIREKINANLSAFLSISKIEITRINRDKIKNSYVNILIFALAPRVKEMSDKIPPAFTTQISANLPNVTDLNNHIENSSEVTNLNNNTTNLAEAITLHSKTENLVDATLIQNIIENLTEATLLLLKIKFYELIRFFQIKNKKEYSIAIQFINNPFKDPVLIAKYIEEQLKKRTTFRRVIKQTIQKVKRTTAKGVKIQISGRLNGAEIARSEWKRYGRIPLHTLVAQIDYATQIVHTVDGIIGIKVWLFKTE